jgi:Skp family chaperone for outer membrane proteins
VKFSACLLVPALVVAGCGGGSSGARSACDTQCPEGSRAAGDGCVWLEARVTCPPGSQFKGGQCMPSVQTAQVDVQRIIEITEFGRAKKTKLKDDYETKQKELDKEQARLMEEKKTIEEGKLSEAAKKVRRKKLEDDLTALQGTYLRFQEDLKVKEQALLSELLNEVRTVAGRIGEERGYAAIFHEQDLVWTNPKQSSSVVSSLRGIPRQDITEVVARALDGKR